MRNLSKIAANLRDIANAILACEFTADMLKQLEQIADELEEQTDKHQYYSRNKHINELLRQAPNKD